MYICCSLTHVKYSHIATKTVAALEGARVWNFLFHLGSMHIYTHAMVWAVQSNMYECYAPRVCTMFVILLLPRYASVMVIVVAVFVIFIDLMLKFHLTECTIPSIQSELIMEKDFPLWLHGLENYKYINSDIINLFVTNRPTKPKLLRKILQLIM